MATQKNFEQSLKKLEQIVEEIESGSLPLEQALKKFEAGVKLSEECTTLLNDAEKKVRILMKDKNGGYSDEPFASDDDSES